MFQSMCFFHVGIVFLFLVTHTRGQQSRVFPTNEKLDWFDARRKCTLLTNERNISAFPTRLGWTNYSAKYLPWVEYLGCFQFRNVSRFYGLEKQVTEGKQLQECIVHCNGSQFLGLQKSTCICLNNHNQTDLNGYIVKSCDTNVATCLEDPFAFCAVGGRKSLSVYQKVSSVTIDTDRNYRKDTIGNCLEYKTNNGNFKAKTCSTKLYPICFSDEEDILKIGNLTKSNWKDAFNNCPFQYLASYRKVLDKGKTFKRLGTFWLSNTRRWQRIKEYTKQPYYCVAAQINQNGVVETILRKCRDKLPGLCTASGTSSVTSSTLSQNTTHLSRRIHTSPFLQSSTLPGSTMATFPHLPKRSIVAIFDSTTSLTLQETTLQGTLGTLFPGFQKTASLGFQETKSPEFHETTSPRFQEITFPLESSSSSVPVSDGIDAILILAIIAAVSLTIIIIIVTVVFCKRKRTTQFTVSDQPMVNVGKEVVYAQVTKPTVKREKSTSSQKSQPAASDDTYDHMDHRRLSETHNQTESNYDTMRSIANTGEEENNYDHMTGTKMESKRFVVDSASNYSHVEVEFHEVKDI